MSSASQRGALRGDAGRVRAGLVGVEERCGVAPSAGPSRCAAAASRRRAAGRSPPPTRATSSMLQQEVRVGGDLGRTRRARPPAPTSVRRRELGDVEAVLARRPSATGASTWVPVCSPVWMLFQYQAGPALVEAADLLQREGDGVRERRRQLQDRRVLRQRRGQVDDLDPVRGDRVEQIRQQCHRGLLKWGAGRTLCFRPVRDPGGKSTCPRTRSWPARSTSWT